MVRVHAPELPQTYDWLNTDRPLSLKQLKGRVVLLDFWTYGCINCLHVLPDLHYLEEKYHDHLTVIGVHSAKFDHEKAVDSVRQAVLRYGIEHPVLIDRDFEVWHQYTVRAWPTFIVIDPQGYVVVTVSGEGKRKLLDQTIGNLVNQKPDSDKNSDANSSTNINLNKKTNNNTVDTQELNPISKKQSATDQPLAFPGKVLADVASKRLFIADTGHHRIVIASLDGVVQHIIGIGKPGLWDGEFDEVQFSAPQGMALDAEHDWLYVADAGNHAVRRVDLSEQTVTTIAGTGEQNQVLQAQSGDAKVVQLNSPWDLASFRHFLLMAMSGLHQIWGLNLNDDQVGTFVGTGAEACVDGGADVAAFAQPSGITTDGKELFVADSEGSSVRALELDNTPQVRTICGSGDLFSFGDRDGQGEQVRLQHCMDVEYGGDNQLWIADTYNHKIKRVDTQTGICQTVFGSGNPALQDGKGTNASFYEPSGLSIAEDWLFVADTNNHAIRRLDLKSLEVTTLSLDLTSKEVCTPEGCSIHQQS